MKTLQTQYNLIKEGKAPKDVFLKQAKHLFPHLIPNQYGFDEAVVILKQKSIITEGYIDLEPTIFHEPLQKESYEVKFEKFLLDEAKKKDTKDKGPKAELKKTDKSVEKIQDNAHDNEDIKNADNVIFDQYLRGIYTEMKADDESGKESTLDELKNRVLKNLAKDPIWYTKNSAFGIKDIGYTDNIPGFHPNKKDSMEQVSKEKIKANVKDTLGKKESASKGKPKQVKSEMTQTPKNSKGVKKMEVPGKEKKIKLKENLESAGLDEFLKEGETGDEGYYAKEDEKYEKYYSLGYQAFIDGVSKEENPYIKNGSTADDDELKGIWDNGWDQAKEDEEKWGEKSGINEFLNENTFESRLKETINKVLEGPLEDADAKLAKDEAAKETELANAEKQRADNKLKIATQQKNI